MDRAGQADLHLAVLLAGDDAADFADGDMVHAEQAADRLGVVVPAFAFLQRPARQQPIERQRVADDVDQIELVAGQRLVETVAAPKAVGRPARRRSVGRSFGKLALDADLVGL